MTVKTTEDGAGDSALVFEQRVRDLCYDEIFEKGTGSEVAYDLIANELLLDGSARLNLATFVTTWMPPGAAALMAQTADKNMIDKDEYPQTAEIERPCVNVIGLAVACPRSRRRDRYLHHGVE
jgi:glutamate/tyrosine decarboxylase-like PLP-dependent enzyme